MDYTRVRTSVYLHINALSEPIRINVYGLSSIGIITPAQGVDAGIKQVCSRFQLADPKFDQSERVEVILGADVYSRLLLPGIVNIGTLLVQNTVLGWVVTGSYPSASQQPTLTCNTTTNTADPWHDQLVGLLQRFWAVEEVPSVVRRSSDDLACEEIFKARHRREASGRYIVPLPVRPNTSLRLGESLSAARQALTSLQRRLQRDEHLRAEYTKFMREYHELGHMRPLSAEELQEDRELVYYIPHHGIWQKSNGQVKLRVVFNASRPTTSGCSLNDLLIPGSKLQNDLISVITHWRLLEFVFCADIKMNFRQVRVLPSDEHLQRIVWSESVDLPVVHYVLTTLTYGTSCAAHLALRTLRQLCLDEGDQLPEAVDAVDKELYVDDFLSGGQDLEAALLRRNQLISLLRRGGFELKKWVANTPALLDGIPPQDRLRRSWLQLATEGPVNELGIAWDPSSDQFKFLPPGLSNSRALTKRSILSDVARFFDPAGWLGPIIVPAKMLLQDLWLDQHEWDDELPEDKVQQWKAICESLKGVDAICLPRWVGSRRDNHLELHAFSDASQRAFAAVVYSRCPASDTTFSAHLLTSKNKLSPIRALKRTQRNAEAHRMTIPRLELRAILLAAQLLRSQARILGVDMPACHIWSDSQVALHWIQSDGPVGHSFVDNYVNHIQELTPGIHWHFVSTLFNPADLATRGANSRDLACNELWWQGPPWLKKLPQFWPQSSLPRLHRPLEENRGSQSPPSRGPPLQCFTTRTDSVSFIEKFSSLDRLLRAMARCRRLLLSNRRDGLGTHTRKPLMGPVNVEERCKELQTCIGLSQRQDFDHELQCLSKDHPVATNSPLATLGPYLDKEGILRVGGRLEHSALPHEEKHPPILDGRSHLSRLIIAWAHSRALHAGFNVTYTYVLKRAWLVGGRSRIRSYIRSCTVCARIHARTASQLMAPLPAVRVNPSRPFSRVGLDYAGPFHVLRSKGRGMSTFKGYVVVFICLATKAIHLELAGDLTTESFLGALSRFSGRRGRPSEIWSDNATNFRGANSELKRMLKEAEMDWGRVEGSLAKEGIRWNFIPPAAPHFGGIWEAGVKSTKAHLKRIGGPRKLTYEEFNTLLVEIEMVLNGRPLVPLTGDLDDLDALTPSHFLIGAPLTSIPQPSAVDDRDVQSHWRLVRGLRDQFWQRWSKEYLNTLQQRSKWTRSRRNLQVGDLVVLVDPSLLRPSGRWPLGRVLQTHPGPDGLVRTATVRTSDNTYLRPITKIVILPSPATVSDPEDSTGAASHGGRQ